MSAEQNLPEVSSHQGPPPSPTQQNQEFAGAQTGSPAGSQEDRDQNFSGGPSVPHGMGQSKSSRRRRRKRKNKGGDAPSGSDLQQGQIDSAGDASAASTGVVSGTIASVQASTASFGGNSGPQSTGPQNAGGSPGSQHGSNGAGTAKRWKKKFRDRERPRRDDISAPSASPGNQAGSGSNGGGGYVNRNAGGGAPSGSSDSHQFGNRVDGWKSRKGGGGAGGGKQGRDRGPRSFVGPMDHSYRVVNGNFAEAPPSTIESRGNQGGRPRSYHSSNDSQPIDYSQGRIVPIAENAPTKIYFFIDDLFFIAKIQETARKLGVKIAFIKNEKEELAKLTGAEEADRPGLIVFDLNNANAKPLTLIPKLKAKLKRSTSIVGFLSHIQGDLKAKAVEAGCDTVMPRAAFSQNLPNLLRRYGLEEEKEDANFNQ